MQGYIYTLLHLFVNTAALRVSFVHTDTAARERERQMYVRRFSLHKQKYSPAYIPSHHKSVRYFFYQYFEN